MNRSEDVKLPFMIRMSYTRDLFKARTNEENTKTQYGLTGLIPKSQDLAILTKLIKEVSVAEWGDKALEWLKDETIKSPILDGDGKQGKDKKTGDRKEGYADHWFIRMTSGENFKPTVVDKKRNPIVKEEDCPSGWYAYVVVNAYTWENTKNGKGVSFGISLVQVAKEGGRLGGTGGADPDKFFDVIDDEGDAPEETKSGKGAGGLFS